jgi:hypothetical protein
MDETVECVVEGEGVGLLADESGAFFEAEVADILAEKRIHGARSCKEKAGFGKASHNGLGCFKKDALAFADG